MDPRNMAAYDGIGALNATYPIDNTTITFDRTKVGGSDQVGLAVTIVSGQAALAGDGEGVEGKLILVEPDGKANVQVGGYMSLPAGEGAALTSMKKVVGDLGPSSAKGYIREVNTATVAELGVCRGSIVNPTDTTNVVIKL